MPVPPENPYEILGSRIMDSLNRLETRVDGLATKVQDMQVSLARVEERGSSTKETIKTSTDQAWKWIAVIFSALAAMGTIYGLIGKK